MKKQSVAVSLFFVVTQLVSAFGARKGRISSCLSKMSRKAVIAAFEASPDADDWVSVLNVFSISARFFAARIIHSNFISACGRSESRHVDVVEISLVEAHVLNFAF